MKQGTERLLRYIGFNLFRQMWTNAATAWHQFWFEPADPLMLGIIRLLGGWMLFYNLLIWTLDLEAFFGDNGLQPLAAIRAIHESRSVFSFWLWTGDAWLWPMHLACLTIAAMFCLGFATRITSVLSFLITISYSQRVPIANFGFDQILGLTCLYLSVGPSGAAVSVDAIIRRWWLKRKGVVESSPRKFASARMSMRLFQLHLCAIYFWAGFAKLKGPTWWTGEAMWNVIANQEYQTIDLTWMAWVPWLPFLIAHVTIAWEVFFIALIWNRKLRPLLLAMGVAMHVGIGAFLGMWTFGLIMAFAYLAFSDPDVWRERISRVTHRRLRDIPETDSAMSIAPVSATAQSHAIMKVPNTLTVPLTPRTDTRSIKFDLAAVSQAIYANDFGNETDDSPADVDRPSTAPAEICIVAVVASERSAMRRYFRDRSLPCRIVSDLQSARDVCCRFRISGVVINSTQLPSADIVEFVEDTIDHQGLSILILLALQQVYLAEELKRNSEVEILELPASLRDIRLKLCDMGLAAASSSLTNEI